VSVNQQPEVFVELRPSVGGWYMRACIEGAVDGMPRVFVGVLGSRDNAAAEATDWALERLFKLREVRL
jgi:hypothetical protein